MPNNEIRVAAVQFGVGEDIGKNLELSLEMINAASEFRPKLIVLPEFINHCSWYEDRDHCYSVAIDINGDFINSISEKASEFETYIVINCTVRREKKFLIVQV